MLHEGVFSGNAQGPSSERPPAPGLPRPQLPGEGPGTRRGERLAAGAAVRGASRSYLPCRDLSGAGPPPSERAAARCWTSPVVCGLSPQSQYYLRWAQ